MEEITNVVNRLYTLRAGLSEMCKLTDKMFDKQLQSLRELNMATEVFNIPNDEYYTSIWTDRRSNGYDNYGSIIFDYPRRNKHRNVYGKKWEMIASRFDNDMVFDSIYNPDDHSRSYEYKEGYRHYGKLREQIKFRPALKKYLMAAKDVPEEKVDEEMYKIMRKYDIRISDDIEALLTWLCSDEGERHCRAHLQRLMSCKKGLLFRRPRFKRDAKNMLRVVNGLPEYRARAENVLSQRDVALNSLRLEYNAFCDALRREYDDLIDERDWKYTDYIIFALETRRADNMKEALRYVDDEIRSNRMVNAMRQAAAQICQTIVEQTDRLIAAIQTCTAQLCVTVAAVGAQIEHLTSAVELNNALVEKSNISSEHLLDVIHTARLYA